MRRRQFARVASAMLLAALSDRRPAASSDGAVRRIAIVASRFSFSPMEIHAAQGEEITLVLSATDFVHGFAIPELNARVDAQPGKTVELALPALRKGRYAWLCDNFCGEGHDRMIGTLVVG